MLGSNKVPSGLRKKGTGTGRKAGWMGNGTGVGCNVMRPLISKRPFMAVQKEEVAVDTKGVDVVAIVVRLDEVGLDGKRHPWRYWGDCHPQRWRWNRQYCRLQGNDNGGYRLRDGTLKYLGKVNNVLLMGVAELGKRGGRSWIGEGLRQGTHCDDGCVDGGDFWHWTLVRKEIALFWRCARLWSWGHKVGSSDTVWEQNLNTTLRLHGGPKCGGRQSSRKLGPLFLEVRGGFN